jgi:hypothetical protein
LGVADVLGDFGVAWVRPQIKGDKQKKCEINPKNAGIGLCRMPLRRCIPGVWRRKNGAAFVPGKKNF